MADIAEIAELSGVPPSTLRYYEEIGLIHSEGRHGLRRQFGRETLTQLVLIALGKAAGFSLPDIAGMFGKAGQPDLPRDLLLQRADAIDRQIRQLRTMADVLRHVADCKAPSHAECPKFQQLMRLATRQTQRARPRKAADRKALRNPRAAG